MVTHSERFFVLWHVAAVATFLTSFGGFAWSPSPPKRTVRKMVVHSIFRMARPAYRRSSSAANRTTKGITMIEKYDHRKPAVPVPADNHPAPGVEHQPPADYMQHDAENGVTVNQTKGTTL